MQYISRYGIYCSYFKNAVLPADRELFAEIMQPSRQKRCQICKSFFVPRAKNQRYCPNCAAVQKRKKAAERQRRNRARSLRQITGSNPDERYCFETVM